MEARLVQEIQRKLDVDSHVGRFNLSVSYFCTAIVVRGTVRSFHQKQIVNSRAIAVLHAAGVKIPFQNEIEVWKPLQSENRVVECSIRSEPKRLADAIDSLSAPSEGENAPHRLAPL